MTVPWRVLQSVEVVSSPWLTVHEQRVGLTHGREIERFHLIASPSWAASLCLTSSSEVVLVRQYRHGLAGPSLELPAGVIEPGEDPMRAAQRELLEETGYVAEDWRSLLAVATEPSRHKTRAFFFVARAAELTMQQSLDGDEDVEVVTLPSSALPKLIQTGEIQHGVHVAAILWAMQQGLLAADSAAWDQT